MYNKKEVYEAAASRRRTDFLITSVIFLAFIIAAGVAIYFVRSNPLGVGVGAVCIVWLIFSLVKSLKKLPPIKDIFADEFEGEITAIDYTVPKNDRTPKKAILTVSENGKSIKIHGISLEAASAYQVGDRVLKIKGTQYPVLTKRDSKIIPCPICGKVRPYTNSICDLCKN